MEGITEQDFYKAGWDCDICPLHGQCRYEGVMTMEDCYDDVMSFWQKSKVAPMDGFCSAIIKHRHTSREEIMITKQQLAALSSNELDLVSSIIQELKQSRLDQRKKELWGNVIAAINKYEQEVESIIIYRPVCGEEFDMQILSEEPGYITIG